MSDLTISIDDELLARARQIAQERGTSLQVLLRDYLQQLAGERSSTAIAEELLDLMHREGGHSRGGVIRREDAYEGRI